jgi:hypothetical protein
LELLTYPETRFAYALLMLERFVKVKCALVDTVQTSVWEEYKEKQCDPSLIYLRAELPMAAIELKWCVKFIVH